MKTLKNKDLAVVFVGCGGTFWTSHPYFLSVLRAIQPKLTVFIDPDKVEAHNTERQWCDQTLDGETDKTYLSLLKFDKVMTREDMGIVPCNRTFQEWANMRTYQEDIEDLPVLMVVNVDNDEARLAIRDWSLEHNKRVVMVMSGCDMNFGQVYYGVYDDNVAVHDWFPLHLDVDPHQVVAPIAGERHGCGAQSILANCMTGSLFCPAIEEATHWLEMEPGTAWFNAQDKDGNPITQVSEWYWNRRNGKTRTWTQTVTAMKGVATNGK